MDSPKHTLKRRHTQKKTIFLVYSADHREHNQNAILPILKCEQDGYNILYSILFNHSITPSNYDLQSYLLYILVSHRFVIDWYAW